MKIKTLDFLDDALDDLSDLPAQIATRILKKLENYAEGQSADVKKLTNRDEYRLRVGDYRVLFIQNDDIIEIHRISHRKDAYN